MKGKVLRIRWQKSELSVFKAKKVKLCRVFYFLQLIYIYLKRYFEIFVTNDFLVYSGGQLLKPLLSYRLKDAMPVPFRSELFTYYICTIFK